MRSRHHTAISLLAGLLFLAAGLSGCNESEGTVTIPAGKQFTVSLQNSISTQSDDAGEEFRADLLEPVMVDGQTVLEPGTTIQGTVTELQKPGNVDDRARMTLEFTAVQGPEGEMHSINTQPITIEAESGTRNDLEKIAAGAVAGAIIGGLTEGGKGAAIGAGVGAAAGGVVVVATKGKHLTLEPGQKIIVQTSGDAEVPVYASQK